MGYCLIIITIIIIIIMIIIITTTITITIKTSETISDSAECYAGLSVRFESSSTGMQLVSSRPKNNLQLVVIKDYESAFDAV